jgi:Fe2+ or Zn2+ uptake regulation protein
MDASQPGANGTPVEWRAVGLRRTRQRQVVLELVRSCATHPTAEWIHREARLRIPDISLATVYRTLRLLRQKGLVHEFSGGASPSRFEGALREHEHIRCVHCGLVADVDLPEAGRIRARVADRTGFRVGRYPLLFHGLCAECASDRRSNGAGFGREVGG